MQHGKIVHEAYIPWQKAGLERILPSKFLDDLEGLDLARCEGWELRSARMARRSDEAVTAEVEDYLPVNGQVEKCSFVERPVRVGTGCRVSECLGSTVLSRMVAYASCTQSSVASATRTSGRLRASSLYSLQDELILLRPPAAAELRQYSAITSVSTSE